MEAISALPTLRLADRFPSYAGTQENFPPGVQAFDSLIPPYPGSNLLPHALRFITGASMNLLHKNQDQPEPENLVKYANGEPVFTQTFRVDGFNNEDVALGPIGTVEFNYTRRFPKGYRYDPWRRDGWMPSATTALATEEDIPMPSCSVHSDDSSQLSSAQPVSGNVPDVVRPFAILPIFVPGEGVALPLDEDKRRAVRLIAQAVTATFEPAWDYLGKRGEVMLLDPINYVAPKEKQDFIDQKASFDKAYRPLFNTLVDRLTQLRWGEVKYPARGDFYLGMQRLVQSYFDITGSQLLPFIITSGMSYYERDSTTGKLRPNFVGHGYYGGAVYVKFSTWRTSQESGDEIALQIWPHEIGHAVMVAGHTFDPFSFTGIASR